MKCGVTEQCSKLKVQRKNTKPEQIKHGPQQTLEVVSGVMEE